ncbi:flagellar hook assembly protein FlgD [Bacillus sp. S/N-304-OC-R1]|uniref:flagellar hook assembly protein FlgD n=1 Tax=Bacillus sp. S/N-304-OC-R1 TaxID=2758034 RepID=UPI001C8D0116|nr:flagellar hook assembly protein FlgD [Bacillus sp. S/N-304-OC-R1]MBY0120691.1 flagellar hook assembly protein FlgD [Bacillus sp. S/N-304-OC-R1]
MTNTIDSSLLLSNYQKEQRKTGSDILGKDDFLKILMVQLQNQDPMNPMQDKDFIAQMATFSTLEQITNMGKTMEKFVKVQEQSQLIAYSQFVGKDITWHKVTEAKDDAGTPIIEEGKGKVASVQFKDNNVLFILDDGTKLEPGNISQVNEISKENAMVQASMLIGKSVTYLADKAEKTGLVKSVSFKDGKTLFQLDDEKNISASQITKIE